MPIPTRTIALSLVACALAAPALAQEKENTLTVATRHVPPFAIKKSDGSWAGFAVELWREVAAENKWKFELVEMELSEMLDAVEQGDVDVAVAALTVTGKREKRLDFAHPFYNSGLGIAVNSQGHGGWTTVLGRIFSWTFVKVLGGLLLLLLMVGLLLYFFERRGNKQDFGGKPAQGIGAALWWAAVTMTTVGYGDKVPRTMAGRCVALVWMFSGIILVSGFTAAVTSALTVSQLESPVQTAADLPQARVASIESTTSADHLAARFINFQPYPAVEQALAALAADQLDAVVYDAPVLRHLAVRRYPGRVQVLPATLEPQNYAFAVPTGSPLREPINQTLLDYTSRREWQETLFRYLGQ